SEVRLRRVGPDGGASAPWTIAETTGNRSAGFPRLGLDGEALRLVWRDGSTPPRLRWARIPQDAEPLTLATAGTP
ncbi:MAG: hypothetical protein KDD11_01580, partial [Acidobacteria bacterium]|nr:hypothetical protein [Acidobacteriota bacterium]